MKSYQQIKDWRDKKINSVAWDHFKLNEFHDVLMKEVVQIALTKVESEWGKPPAHFAFFVMGSAGRKEQSVWSDQDHGIVYEATSEFQNYFIRVGEEITKGLEIVGYERCEGNVMASNSFWCKSSLAWQKQIIKWLDVADWASLRYFSIFLDSRALVGDESLLLKLKDVAFSKLANEPYLYQRLYENVSLIKKGFGIFGQLLIEDKGENVGTINVKETIFFPYVNSLRLLALLEKITHSSTVDRFHLLSKKYQIVKDYQADFVKLLNYRLYFQRDAVCYKKVHLIQIKRMSSKEKENVKEMMKKGRKLYKETKEIIDKRCSP